MTGLYLVGLFVCSQLCLIVCQQGELDHSRRMEVEARRLAESAQDKVASGLSADKQAKLQSEIADLRTKVQEMDLQMEMVTQERDELKGNVKQLVGFFSVSLLFGNVCLMVGYQWCV